ncbi:MAG: OmpA family protein [Bacteroidales bacterium]
MMACPVQAGAQDRRVEIADKAFELKQYHEAIDLYRKAYNKVRRKDRQEAARLVFQTALSYRMTNDFLRAEPWFRRAILMRFPDPRAVLYLADAQMKNEKFQEALKSYRDYQELQPDDPQAQLGIASAQMAMDLDDAQTQYQVEVLRALNSRQDDFTPAYGDHNNNSLIFSSSRDEALGDDTDPWTGGNHTSLFIAYQNRTGDWDDAVLLDEGPINTEYNEGAPSVNVSATELFFTRCVRAADVDMGCRIFVARREGSGWGQPQEIPITNDSTVSVGHPAISPDDMALYFASDMPGGLGGNDIWVVHRRAPGDPWGPPENLGPVINTPADDLFPYVRENGVLYFASEGRPGLGGLDIFASERNREGWSEPVNIEVPFNSPGDDFGIVFDSRREQGFFSSNRKGSRGYTLYSFMLPPLELVITGTVRDDSTSAILPGATVQLVGSDGTLFQAEADSRGIYEFGKNIVRENTRYDLLVSKENYFSERSSESTIEVAESKVFVHDFSLLPIPETPIELPEILYEFGRWELQPQFQDSLNTLVQTLEDNPTIIIELASHTDSRGADAINDTLSQRRAQAVVDYLIKKGIDPDRLRAKGYGKRVPRVIESDIEREGFEFAAGTVLDDDFINSLPTEEHQDAAHQLNRRTEFRVLSDDFVPPEVPGQRKPVPVEIFNQQQNEPPD